jgi:hypothetical protein
MDRIWSRAYLQLHECETSAGSNAAVVFDCRTSDDRSELVDWARSDGCGFRNTSCSAAGFATGLGSKESVLVRALGVGGSWSHLIEMDSDSSLPVFVKV